VHGMWQQRKRDCTWVERAKEEVARVAGFAAELLAARARAAGTPEGCGQANRREIYLSTRGHWVRRTLAWPVQLAVWLGWHLQLSLTWSRTRSAGTFQRSRC